MTDSSTDYNFKVKDCFLGAQMLFVAFGALVLVPEKTAMIIGLCSLATTVIISILGRGILKLIPILCGIAVGYVLSLIFGIVNFDSISKAAWFSFPNFVMPEWNLQAIFFIVPIAIAPAIEHFGDVMAIGGVTGKDYLKEPGIQNTMLVDYHKMVEAI